MSFFELGKKTKINAMVSKMLHDLLISPVLFTKFFFPLFYYA